MNMEVDDNWLDHEEQVVELVEVHDEDEFHGVGNVDYLEEWHDQDHQQTYDHDVHKEQTKQGDFLVQTDADQADAHYVSEEYYEYDAPVQGHDDVQIVHEEAVVIQDHSNQQSFPGENLITYVEYVHETATNSKRKLTVAQCDVCGALLKYPSKIQAHMRTHTGEKPFECSVCGMKFSQRTPMLAHYRRHLGDMPHACSICGKKFVHNSQKVAHELRHNGVKRRGPPRPYLKPPKRHVFTALPGLPPTQIVNHASVDDIAQELIEYDNPDELLEEVEHNQQSVSAISQESSKRIDEVIDAVAAGSGCSIEADQGGHMHQEPEAELETQPAPAPSRPRKPRQRAALVAQCHICGLMLKHPSKIQAHMRTHTGEKPFTCVVCGAKFANMYSVQMHVRRKHIVHARSIPCSWNCGKAFVSIGARNEHERVVHSGMKRYQCSAPGCSQMFTRRTYLMRHRIKDHPNLYSPIFDPHEVIAAEAAQNNQEVDSEDVMYEITDQGLVVLCDDSAVMEGQFVDDDADAEYQENVDVEEVEINGSEAPPELAPVPNLKGGRSAFGRTMKSAVSIQAEEAILHQNGTPEGDFDEQGIVDDRDEVYQVVDEGEEEFDLQTVARKTPMDSRCSKAGEASAGWIQKSDNRNARSTALPRCSRSHHL